MLGQRPATGKRFSGTWLCESEDLAMLAACATRISERRRSQQNCRIGTACDARFRPPRRSSASKPRRATELHEGRRRAGADAKRGVPADRLARRVSRREAVPPQPARRGADRGRRRLARRVARAAGRGRARHARPDVARRAAARSSWPWCRPSRRAGCCRACRLSGARIPASTREPEARTRPFMFDDTAFDAAMHAGSDGVATGPARKRCC